MGEPIPVPQVTGKDIQILQNKNTVENGANSNEMNFGKLKLIS